MTCLVLVLLYHCLRLCADSCLAVRCNSNGTEAMRISSYASCVIYEVRLEKGASVCSAGRLFMSSSSGLCLVATESRILPPLKEKRLLLNVPMLTVDFALRTSGFLMILVHSKGHFYFFGMKTGSHHDHLSLNQQSNGSAALSVQNDIITCIWPTKKRRCITAFLCCQKPLTLL